MIVDYTNRTYRITYQGVAMVENALDNPNLVQISVVSGCVIMVAPQKDYGISYLPNGEYRTWNLDGLNTRLNRAEEHFIYARLSREDNSALIVFSVNDYAVDGSTGGGEPSESYYYIKIGKITHTDKTGSDATIDREITLDFGYLDTPAAQDDTGWRELFEVTADNLIRPLKRFASFIVQGTLSIIGKLVINDKAVSDIARQGDVESAAKNDETLPTTAYLAGKYLEELRTRFLNKDKEDQTKFLQTFLGGIVSEFMRSPDFVSGMSGAGFAVQRNADGTSYAEVDRLLVRMKAVFQMLEILKTDIAGGELVLNAGARLTVTKAETLGDVPAYFADGSEAYFLHGERAYFAQSYRLHFLADDGETRIQNLFHVGDLARCQTFGIEAGAYEGVSNRFWWRLVTAVGDDWIEVSSTVCAEGSDIPKEGDVVSQWGNDRDTDRQAVMVLSAYGQGAPSITMYQGVDSFSLSGKDVFTAGYDPVKKRCVLRNYGDAYIGDRGRNYFVELSRENGLVIQARKFLMSTGEDLGEMIAAVDGKISLQITKDDLRRTGIDIDAQRITVTTDSFFIRDTLNNPIAIFSMVNGVPKLKTEAIDVDSLRVKHLDGADGTFTGSLSAATGTFHGSVNIAEGKIQLNSDGSGRLANGNISWDSNGNLSMNYSIAISRDGYTLRIDPEFAEYRIYHDGSGTPVVMISGFGDIPGTSPVIRMYAPNSSFSADLDVMQLSLGDANGTFASFGIGGIQFREGGTVYDGKTQEIRVVTGNSAITGGFQPEYRTFKFRNGLLIG